MAQLNFEQMMQHSSGGNSFFTMKNNEELEIRVLYNNYSDILGYMVHEFNSNGNYATILCGREESNDTKEACKWCQMNNVPVCRCVIPIFNMQTNEIQYWKRSEVWIKNELKPLTDEVLKQNKNICSQVYKIKRLGDGLKTKYTLIPIGQPDNSRKEDFGEIKNPLELNIFRDTNYQFDPQAQPNNYNQGNYNQGNYNQGNYNQGNYNQGNYNQGNYNQGNYNSTRRTTEIF